MHRPTRHDVPTSHRSAARAARRGAAGTRRSALASGGASVLCIGPIPDEVVAGIAGSFAAHRARSDPPSVAEAMALQVDAIVIDDGIGWDRVYAQLEELTRQHAAAPAVVTWRDASADMLVEAALRGACRSLCKPVHPEDLVSTLDEALLQVDRAGVHARLRQRMAGFRLTPRERDLAIAVLRGLSNEEIARSVQASLPTTREALHALYYHLGISSRAELFQRLIGV